MTMSTSDLGATAERLLDLAHQAGAEEVQVRAERETERRVSFERGALHLATAGAETRFSIRVHKDQRLGAVRLHRAEQDHDRCGAAAAGRHGGRLRRLAGRKAVQDPGSAIFLEDVPDFFEAGSDR